MMRIGLTLGKNDRLSIRWLLIVQIISFRDFDYFQMTNIVSIRYVGGFARAATITTGQQSMKLVLILLQPLQHQL